MILLFDCGNTNISCANVVDNKINKVINLNTHPIQSADNYYISLSKIFDLKKVKEIAISSVVPKVSQELKKLALKLNIDPIIVEKGTKTGLFIKTDNPNEVGADLICGAVSVMDKGPALVIDLGTATKYLYVNDNSLKGVVIAPGVEISLKSLAKNTALLPEIEIEVPKKVLNNNTITTMQSGVTYGTASQIEGMIKRIEKETNKKLNIYITGGLAKLIYPLLDLEVNYKENLVLDGLLKIYNKNKKNRF